MEQESPARHLQGALEGLHAGGGACFPEDQKTIGNAWTEKSEMANAGISGRAQEGREGKAGFYLLHNVVIEIDHKNRVHLNRA